MLFCLVFGVGFVSEFFCGCVFLLVVGFGFGVVEGDGV